MKNLVLFLVLSLFLSASLHGQIKIGENPQNLDASSVLELESTTRALVITRVTNAQMLSIIPLRGAIVYNTDTQCIHFYTGTEWFNPCDLPDQQTFTADPIVNGLPTIVITEDPANSNFNFEVGMINGITNIVPSTVNGDLHIQPNSIFSLQLGNDSVTLDKIADGILDGQLIQWDESVMEWVLIEPTDLAVTELDGIIGNEIANVADATLIRTGSGTDADPFLVDVSPLGITEAELANDAVTTNKILNGNVTNAKLDKANIPLSGFQAAAANVDLGGNQINNLQNPTQPQDAATRSYVDAEILASAQTVVSADAGNSITASGTDGGAFYDDSALQTAIADNDTEIGTNQTNITTNATNLANHILADGDLSLTNEVNTRFEINGGNLELEDSNGTFSVLLSDLSAGVDTDDQTLNTDGNPGNISIDNGNDITINVNDLDFNPTNEIQDLDFTAGQITLSGDPTPTTIDLSGYDTNAADDFDGLWGSLGGVPAGFADNIDNVDDADNNASNEIQDLDFTAGQITLSGDPTPTTIDLSAYDSNAADDFDGLWGSLGGVPAGFADNVDDDTTYSDGAGLTLTGTTFSVDNLAGDVTGPTSATVIANNAVTSAKIADGTISDDDISGTAAIAGSKINPVFTTQIDATLGITSGADILLNGNNLVADYVFQKYFNGHSKLKENYIFTSLKEIEAFVKKNKHLPGVTSAAQAQKDGFWNLSDSNMQNLEKIEELFLHTIEQEKKIEKLESENEKLSNELDTLKSELLLIKELLMKKDD